MRYTPLIIAACLLAFASCSDGSKGHEEYLSTADSTVLSGDLSDIHSPSRKILHNANIGYKVKDVLAATTQTEQLVNKVGGMVVKSEVMNQTVSVNDQPYKDDSLKHTELYEPRAQLTLKVPVEQMDSLIKLISANAQFVMYRTIAQKDLTYSYLSNAMKNEKAERKTAVNAPQASVVNKSTTVAQPPVNTIAEVDNRDEKIVDRRVTNLQLLEETNYATLEVQFTQPALVNTEIIVNADYITRTPFGTQLRIAGSKGADLLGNIVLAVAMLWPVWLLSLIAIFIYRYYRKPAMQQKKV